MVSHCPTTFSTVFVKLYGHGIVMVLSVQIASNNFTYVFSISYLLRGWIAADVIEESDNDSSATKVICNYLL